MKPASIKIIYNRRNKLNADGKAKIDLDISFGGKRRYVSTDCFVKPNEFDTKQREVKNCVYAVKINSIIRAKINAIRDREQKLFDSGNFFTIDDLLSDDTQNNKNFLEFVKKEAERRDVKTSQKNAYQNLIANLTAFFGKYIPFDSITSGFIKDFDKFLRTKTTLHQNTIHKRHILLRIFVNAAIEEHLLNIDPYLRFKFKRLQTERFALSEDELKKFENAFCTDDKTQLVKDLFLFGCYTGLRFQDIMDLKKENIIKSEDGKVFLHTRENKTQKLKDIPLHKLFDGKPIQIIEKYANKYRDSLFPSITNQHANRILKGFAIGLQIDTKLSFHISRHTFGTIIAEKTQDPYLVKDLMNHADIKTSMKYTHTAKNNLERKLENVVW